MPDKRFRPRRLPRAERRDARDSGPKLQRAAVPQPSAPMTLRPALQGDGSGSERWELICRDGWEWQPGPAPRNGGPPTVWVRTAILTADQAAIVRQWLDRIGDPGTWWAVSRALQTPEGSPTVAPALQQHPWLHAILSAVLEASTDGAPPPPPASAS